MDREEILNKAKLENKGKDPADREAQKDGGLLAYIVGVCLLLCLIAVGVLLIVRSSIVWDGFHKLLEEDDYSREAKSVEKRFGWIAGSYWLLVTAGFLAWSFLSGRWDITWIVWPIAGVLYGAIYGILRALNKKAS